MKNFYHTCDQGPFIPAIRAYAAGTADADTREALDIFEIRVLDDRIIVDFAPNEEPG